MSRLNVDIRPAAQETLVSLTNTLGEQFIELPTNFILPKAMTLVDPNAYELQLVSAKQLNDANQAPESGPPIYYAIIGSNIYMWPEIAVDEQITVQMVYLASFDTPTEADDTNYILSTIPHIWFHCVQMYTAQLTQDFELFSLNKTEYTQSIRDFKTQENSRRFSGAPFQIRGNRNRIV